MTEMTSARPFPRIPHGFVALLAAAALAFATPAFAISLDAAKEEGLVGEQANGYLAVVDPSRADAEVERLVERVNDERRKRYESIAERNGVTLNVVEKLAGKKAIEKTPPGQYVKPPDQDWRPK